MRQKLTVLFSFLAIFLVAIASAQPKVHSAWTASLKDADLRAGEYGQIIFESKIDDDWYIYGPQIQGYWQESGATFDPASASIITSDNKNLWPAGEIYKVADEEGNPEATDVVIYKHAVRFALPFPGQQRHIGIANHFRHSRYSSLQFNFWSL